MRIDTRHLRRDISTHAQHTAGQLIHQLEGAQIEIMSGAG
jgi:hypothetical protein